MALNKAFLYCILLLFPTAFAAPLAPKPLVFAHWMPWFQYPQNAFHWPPIGGVYYTPIIGYYSTQNETVMDWQLSLMEYAGIDGIIVDWYGTADQNDYAFIKQSTDLIWNKIQTKYANFTLGICYDLNSHATTAIWEDSMTYLKQNYFDKKQYLKYGKDSDPILLMWPSHNSDATLQTANGLSSELQKLGLTDLYVFVEFRNGAFSFEDNTFDNLGVFDWVYPQSKSSDKQSQISQVISDTNYYYSTAGNAQYRSKFYLGAMHHGFSDHYVSAGTDTTNPYNALGFIDLDYDYLNIIYAQTYDNNTSGNYPFLIQIPTWNDYSEGTIIEPNMPTLGCTKGCNDDTAANPYRDLVTLYKLFVDSSADDQQVQQGFEAITKKFFPNL